MRALHHAGSVVGIVVVLASFTSPWWTAVLSQGSSVSLTGSEAEPLVWSLVLAVGAAYGASLLLNGFSRRFALGLMAVLGLVALVLLADLSSLPSEALARAVEGITGIAGSGALDQIETVQRTFAPVAGLVGVGVALVGAVAGQFVSRSSSKRDRYSSQPGTVVPGDPQGAWDSLSEGYDPTTSVD